MLDPLNPLCWSALAVFQLSDGKLAEALESTNRSLQISPEQTFTPAILMMILLLQKKPAEALEASQRSTMPVFRLLGATAANESQGRPAESERALAQLENEYAFDAAYQIAEAHAWRGERDLAFRWLERARVQRDDGLSLVQVDPMLAALRGDPRWAPLLRDLHLPAR